MMNENNQQETSLVKMIIINRLKELKETNWRNDFERTWVMEICDSIHQSGLGNSEAFWNDFINISVKSPVYKTNLALLWFDGDMSVISLIEEIDAQARGKGSFEMPSWGTYGT
jgi:hypothetical protein